MSAKDELKQLQFKMRKAEETLEEYEKFKTRAEKITAVLSDVPARSNKTSDKVGENAVIMADLFNEYLKAWQEAELERLSLVGRIKYVDEPYRTILFMRYVQNKKFETISSDIGYSYKQILRLHGEALRLYEKDKDVLKCP